MLLFYLVTLLLCVYESEQKQIFNDNKYKVSNTMGVAKRLVEIMRSYYEEAHSRSRSLNAIRFKYEESPFYEMGYIIGEILERYMKVLGHTQKSHEAKDMPLFNVIKRVEFVQTLYFEIYHLVRMMHETPRKWVSVKEYANLENKLSGIDDPSANLNKKNVTAIYLAMREKHKKEMEKLKKIREGEKKKRKAHYQQQRDEMLKAKKRLDYNLFQKYNPVWPIDYGWEVQKNTW